ncbi:hypothetical protein V6N13_135243 [Hibiscus sabdariffa]
MLLPSFIPESRNRPRVTISVATKYSSQKSSRKVKKRATASTSAQILTSFRHELRACLRFRLVKTTIRESGCENCPFFKMDEDNERVAIAPLLISMG